MFIAQVTIPIEFPSLWSLLGNTIIFGILFYAGFQRIKSVIEEKQSEHSEKIRNETDISIHRFEASYEQRLLLLEQRMIDSQNQINQNNQIIKTLETHNMHILKAVDDIKDSVTRLHERLDNKEK